MPPLAGENRVQTVFADIHYYFTAPTPRPLHHRFDKGCYLYIYHNGARRSTRIEIANHPGTSDQDAFQGSLESVKLRYSYTFPTLLTVVVDADDLASRSPSTPPVSDEQEWRLASADPRDQGQYKYRLHTLDVYFWTIEDAKAVMETCQRLLRSEQVNILDAPPKSSNSEKTQEGALSPVVQQLENVAITDPAYRNGQTRNSQNQATALPPPPPPPATTRGSSTQTPSSQAGSVGPRSVSVKSDEAQTNFTPMAYNPAAPAAPEPIAHREKTPPPPDAGDGIGLGAAAYADDNQGYAQQHQSQSHNPGSSQQQQPTSGHYGPAGAATPQQPGPGQYGSQRATAHATPPPPGQTFLQHRPSATSMPQISHRSSTVASQAASPLSAASPAGSRPSFSPQLGGYAPASQQQHHQGFASSTPSQIYPQAQQPLESPSSQVYGSSQQPPPHQIVPHLQPHYPDYLQSHPMTQRQSQHQSPQPGHHHQRPPHSQQPLGGYSQYSYSPQQQQQQQPPASQYPSYHHQQPHPHQHQHQQHQHQHHHHQQQQQQQQPDQANRYDVHNQLYRPTEDEDKHRRRQSSAVSVGGPGAGSDGGGGGSNKKPGSRLDSAAGKMDKRVGGFLKKLEKKL